MAAVRRRQRSAAAGDKRAAAQRSVQRQVENDEKRNAGGAGGRQGAVQAGTRRQPRNPLPEQHQKKPGSERKLKLRPQFRAPDYKGSGKLDGMVALITGGDSGIGRAVAVLFAREGADVAIIYLNEHADAKETCSHVEQEGRRCIAIAGDVTRHKFCERAVGRVVRKFGRLDILVNNAAFQQHAATLETLTEKHLQQTLQTNIGGYFHMARAALPHLKNGSCIINTGSETARFGQPQLLDYSATKGAIQAFTKALAGNLVKRGIRVNCVEPGPVWTPLNPADRPAKAVTKFGKGSAMGRPAQPEELSPTYVFLASPVCSSYVSGAVLPVMGGPRG